MITYDKIVAFNPCYDPIKYIPKDYSNSVIDMLSREDIPAKDRLWVVVREDFLTLKQIHLYGLGCARLSEKYSTDARVKACNDIVEAYLQGKATKQELSAAASAAWSAESAESAESAAWSAAWSAAASAAASAAWSAAWSAAESAAARSVTEVKQCKLLIKIIQENP